LIHREAWVEYDLGQGVYTYDAFWKCGAFFTAARQLLAAGYRCCAPDGKVASAFEKVRTDCKDGIAVRCGYFFENLGFPSHRIV
jgi:hypothetical protein